MIEHAKEKGFSITRLCALWRINQRRVVRWRRKRNAGDKGIFLYLFLLLDEYSRKAIQWHISFHQTAEEAQRLLESGPINENILDLPEGQRPEVINDRGR